MSKFAAIPQPTERNLLTTVLALKEAVEVLTRQRGEIGKSAVTWDELQSLHSPTGEPLIDPRDAPKKHGT